MKIQNTLISVCNKQNLRIPVVHDVSINSHSIRINDKIKLICEYCNKHFRSTNSLNIHIGKCNDNKIKRLDKKVKDNKKTHENEYIYVLQEREFLRNGEKVYKLGKTVNPKQRFSSYPKGSKVHMVIPCEDCSEAEKYLLDLFKVLFIQRKDIGLEYFEGDLLEMTKTAMRYLMGYE